MLEGIFSASYLCIAIINLQSQTLPPSCLIQVSYGSILKVLFHIESEISINSSSDTLFLLKYLVVATAHSHWICFLLTQTLKHLLSLVSGRFSFKKPHNSEQVLQLCQIHSQAVAIATVARAKK